MSDPDALSMYVVSFDPKDYPGRYVVREQRVLPPGRDVPEGFRAYACPSLRNVFVATEPLAVTASLDSARRAVPEGLFCMARNPEDDPVIVEVWL